MKTKQASKPATGSSKYGTTRQNTQRYYRTKRLIRYVYSQNAKKIIITIIMMIIFFFNFFFYVTTIILLNSSQIEN